MVLFNFFADDSDVATNLDPAKYVYCGDTEPIWVCCNAFVPEHKCTFAYCSQCNSNRVTPGRSQAKKRKAETLENQCDHTDLTPFSDCTYLRRSYLLSCREKGDKIPEKCVSCHRFFSEQRIIRAV